ncbi:MAG: hypothetical protein QN174_07795 [Armatimonadota bacterium]|nr:hypothetical protein [Armatimonadota bacterium]
MKAVKAAIYGKMVADATLRAKLGSDPYIGRLPDTAKLTRTKALISMEGETRPTRGSKEEVTITCHIWSLSHDVAEDVAADLARLFHPTAPRRYWVPLITTGGDRAFTRLGDGLDLPDPTSEVWHRLVRIRVQFAKRAP